MSCLFGRMRLMWDWSARSNSALLLILPTCCYVGEDTQHSVAYLIGLQRGRKVEKREGAVRRVSCMRLSAATYMLKK